ncbi:hypothetical protein Cgig2_014163 [Carnegiea gigantea]|uniref:DUF4283 domain-containing protein n=1 Tax=Carnegiea gigantea TaxID=171969 RepID=A0A9Q1Q5M2_9CARY|nr:hypothetical protein Cgig2_014163 [Carnegiea gigantea]
MDFIPISIAGGYRRLNHNHTILSNFSYRIMNEADLEVFGHGKEAKQPTAWADHDLSGGVEFYRHSTCVLLPRARSGALRVLRGVAWPSRHWVESIVSSLEETMKRFTLAEAEEEAIVCDDVTPYGRGEEITLILLRKLYTENNFNVKAFKSDLRNIWKPTRSMVIKELDKNLFLFKFFAQTDRVHVLNEGRWPFDGCILLLNDILGKSLRCSPNETNVGSNVFIDEKVMMCVDKALKFRVDIAIKEPLRRGIMIKIRAIKFKYLELPEFYYGCGKLGHVYARCDKFEEDSQEEDLQYGGWLRASPMKGRGCNAKAELMEERKFSEAFRNKKATGKVKTKLKFDKPKMSTPSESLPQGNAGYSSSLMVIDEGALIATNDLFKRKLEDARLSPSLVLLLETKLAGVAMAVVKKQFDDDYGAIGHAIKSQSMLQAFCKTLDEYGIYDLGFSGYDHTQWNQREGDASVEECLDMYYASMEWCVLLSKAEVIHLNQKLSDHLPIELKLNDLGKSTKRRNRDFKFEQTWVTEEGIKSVVEEAWVVACQGDNW